MKYIFTLAIVFVLSVSAFTHTNEEAEGELVGLFSEIEKYSSYSADYSDDRDENLSAANKAFRNALLRHTAQHASLLSYAFPRLSKKIRIGTAPNGHLRVYSWDTLTGGTMHMYDNVYQFRGVEGVSSRGTFHEEEGPQSFVNDVYNIDMKTGTVYLVSTTSIFSSSSRGAAIRAFQVDGNLLSDNVKIIKTASGLTDTIGFSYDFFSVVDREERPIRLFRYDPESRSISFPVVVEDDKTPQGRVTSAKIVYRFNGEHFVRVRN